MDIDFMRDENSRLYRRLIENGYTSCLSILATSVIELQEVLDINRQEVEHLLDIVTARNLCVSTTGDVQCPRLSTGCTRIDRIIRGGLPVGQLIEIYGRSGVGKTQFCLQLLIMVQLPRHLGGLNKAAVYICTNPFPSRRFHQLSREAPARFGDNIEFEENCFIDGCLTVEKLRKCIMVKLPNLMERVSVGLIVIDAIASVFRADQSPAGYKAHCYIFYEIVIQLRKLCMKYNAVAVSVNQVTDNIESGQGEPSLGPLWSTLVPYRYCIERPLRSEPTRVFLSLPSSPGMRQSRVEFHIGRDGLK